MDETFSLGDRGDPGIPGDRHADIVADPESVPDTVWRFDSEVDAWVDRWVNPTTGGKVDAQTGTKTGVKTGGKITAKSDPAPSDPYEPAHRSVEPPIAQNAPIPRKLERAAAELESVFYMPHNQDVVTRSFAIAMEPPVRALAVFMDGMVDSNVINNNVLLPLMRPTDKIGRSKAVALTRIIMEELLPGNQTDECGSWTDVAKHVVDGDTVLLIDGSDRAVAIGTKGWEYRKVTEAKTESTLSGALEGFTENLRTNTAMIRRRLRTPALVTEVFRLGDLSQENFCLMYIRGVANPKLVAEARRRLHSVKTDFVTGVGTLAQFIEDSPTSLFPTGLRTERPDRVASALSEGSVAIVGGATPFAHVVPISIWALIHAPDDVYERWPVGSFLRVLRLLALFIALLVPALYIAVTNFHPEMLPTDLLLVTASSRETVPFPVVVEVLLMEVAFELIREAGVRVPSVMGNTIGIVGALILGQAAVAAGIISPILVITVAITGLASFAIADLALNHAVRLIRFILLVPAGVAGFFGVAVALISLIVHVVSLRSFGVPLLSPVAPYRPGNRDVILRRPAYAQARRPRFLRALRPPRQPPYVRTWDPYNPSNRPDDEDWDPRGGSDA